MIKVVILSMESARDRREAIAGRLGRLGVDFDFYCPPLVSDSDLRNPEIYCEEVARSNTGLPMSRQEVSCALGHLGIYADYLEHVDGLVVLEDDAIVLDGFASFIDGLSESGKSGILRDEFFLLGGQQFLPGEREAVFGRRPSINFGDYSVHRSCFSRMKLRRTVGYFIGANCMRRALLSLHPVKARADDWWYQVACGVMKDTSMLSPIVIAHPPITAGQSSIRSADADGGSQPLRLTGVRWRLALAFRLIISIFR